LPALILGLGVPARPRTALAEAPARRTVARKAAVRPASAATATRLLADGAAAYRRGQFELARGLYQQSYQLDPRVKLRFNIAQCERRLGRMSAALEHYREYLRMWPDAPNRAEVARMVAELEQKLAPARATTTAIAGRGQASQHEPGSLLAPDAARAALLPTASSLMTAAAVRPVPIRSAVASAPEPPRRRHWAKSWWFWTAVGAAAIGAGVGAAFAIRNSGPSGTGSTLGDQHVIPTLIR
jgi:tetratricopeptide (TPR) repeat protein